jgi:hypothetical protein
MADLETRIGNPRQSLSERVGTRQLDRHHARQVNGLIHAMDVT